MNIIVEILSIIIAIFLWAFLFRKREEVEHSKEINLINVYVEKIGEFYYAWHEKTFMFQTKDTKELVQYIKEKFPNNIIKISSDKELAWLQEAKKALNLN